MKCKLRDTLTHHILSLTVTKVIKWSNSSQLKRNHRETNKSIHNKKITILVTVVKKTSHKKSYKRLKT